MLITSTLRDGPSMLEPIPITSLPGLRLGNAQDLEAATGCTVLLFEGGAVAGVDVRGGAPGTRETDLLRPENLVERIHAVVLAGGSAFGLDAAGGVMAYLEARGIGFDVGVAKVPIVCGAVLFDLVCGDAAVRPDRAMGHRACLASEHEPFAEGSVGAGTGATVGKALGLEHAMKGGLGAFACRSGALLVGAVVAVNCLGDVVDPASGRIVAGAHRTGPFAFLDCEAGMLAQASATNRFAGNTTIGAVVTNAALTKAQATKLASMAHDGFARTMRPAHTLVDGDTVFALSVGEVAADLSTVGLLAARAMERAVLRAVTEAAPLAGFRACRELPGP
jgi:L-aminopeptidase/D-esterase-like protein